MKTVVAHQATNVGCEAYRGLVSGYNWNVDIALAVMQAESSCRTNAYNLNSNGSTDIGLMQINSIHACQTYDITGNIACAYQVYQGGGWDEWTTYSNGSYLKFL